MLPFPIVGTNSMKPDANFLSYKTVGKYCQLDTCKTGIVNNEMCDQLDCTGDVSPYDNHDYPDPNALWMRDASGKCQFYKCKPNFISVDNSCVSSDDICKPGSHSADYKGDPDCEDDCPNQVGYRICGTDGKYGKTCICTQKPVCNTGDTKTCTCVSPTMTEKIIAIANAAPVYGTVNFSQSCLPDHSGWSRGCGYTIYDRSGRVVDDGTCP
jgi:hypothetical protein